jgi:hypothetical protein
VAILDDAGVLTIASAAPSLVLQDTTGGAASFALAVDGNLAELRNSGGAAGSLVTLDLANNRFGFRTTTFVRSFHVTTTDATRLERTTATLNATVGAAEMVARTTGDMADGFGPSFSFLIADDTQTNAVTIGGFSGIRSGADNTGAVSINTTNAGSVTQKVLVGPTGLTAFASPATFDAETRIHAVETATGNVRGILSAQHNSGTHSARLLLRKSRGSRSAPTVIVTGDVLGEVVASGYDGSAYLQMGAIVFQSTGTIASTRVPTKIVFQTATNAAPSVLTTALTLDEAQNATFAGKITQGTGGIVQRVVSVADATSFTPNADTTDVMTQTNTQAAGTLTANAPSGTPANGQLVEWVIKCTNSHTWSFNGIYRGSTDLPLPTTTTGSSKKDRLVWQYDSGDTKWDLTAQIRGY